MADFDAARRGGHRGWGSPATLACLADVAPLPPGRGRGLRPPFDRCRHTHLQRHVHMCVSGAPPSMFTMRWAAKSNCGCPLTLARRCMGKGDAALMHSVWTRRGSRGVGLGTRTALRKGVAAGGREAARRFPERDEEEGVDWKLTSHALASRG